MPTPLLHTMTLLVALHLLAGAADQGAPALPQLKPGASAPVERVKVASAGLWKGPDGDVLVGVRFTMAPKWHIYWSNPGASGFSPSYAVEGAPAWGNEPIIFPRPDIIGHGEEVNFGYEGAAVLLLHLTPSDDAKAAHATISVKYLVCKEACVAGEGKVTVDLPDRAAIAALPAIPEIVEGRRIPITATAAKATSSVDAKRTRFTIQGPLPAPAPGAPPEPQIRFIPHGFPGFIVKEALPVAGKAKEGRFSVDMAVSLEPNDTLGKPLRAGGLVLFGTKTDDSCFDIVENVKVE